MAIARQASVVKKNLKFFVYGKQGTRKSTFALDFSKMNNEEGRPLRVFYLDTEFGSIDNYLESYEDDGVDLRNIFIVQTNTYSEAEEWLDKVINNEELWYENEDGEMVLATDSEGNSFIADVVVLDSATPLQDTIKYSMIQISEKRAKLRKQKDKDATKAEIFVAEATAGMEFKDYDKLNAKGKNLLRGLITRTNKIVCVTSREKDKKDKVKTGNGEFDTVKIGVQPDCFKDAEYEFFTVVHMYDDEETGSLKGQIENKDRTLRFERGEILDEPSPLLWQSVIAGNKDKKSHMTMKEKYEDVVTAQSEELYATKQVKPQLSNKQADVTETVEETEEFKDTSNKSNVDIVEEIKAIRAKLTPAKKQALSANFTKEGLPKQPSAEMQTEVLSKMLSVAKAV